MREYGKIKTTIWKSKKFKSVPDDSARLLYFYLHTCMHVNSIGCYDLPVGYIHADTKWPIESIERDVIALSEARLIDYSEAQEVVRIIDFLEHSPITNAKHFAGSAKLALALPDCEEKDKVIMELRCDQHCPEGHPIFESTPKKHMASDTPIEAPTETTETETETETDKEEEKDNLTVISKENDVSDNPVIQENQITEPDKSATKRGTRLPDDWTPSNKLIAWAQGEGIDLLMIERETAKFKDFWPAKPGQGGLKLDWDRTWKNWLRTAKERQPTNRPRPGGGNGFAQIAMERSR